jgi:hypothetical protein
MISNIRSAAVLLLAILTTLATSATTYQKDFATGTYQVKSDCPNAQTEGQLVLSEADYSSVTGIYQLNDGTAFGFPSNTLISGKVSDPQSAGKSTVEDGSRICKAMLWERKNNSGLFVCHRGDELECTIHLQKI